MTPNENEVPFAHHLKTVVVAIKDEDGGWELELSCGHKVWCAVDPGNQMYCGACLDAFAKAAFAAARAVLGPVPPGTPYGSRDVGHVKDPDPEYFWPFTKGQHRVVAYQPSLTFEVTEIHDNWIGGLLCLERKRISGELHLDLPVVVVREPNGAPAITFTLRKIEAEQAFLQISVGPNISIQEHD